MTVAVLAPQQAGALAPSAVPVTVVDYDSHDAAQYAARWVNPYGPLDGVVPQVDASGAVTLSDVPFKPGTDFSVFDHLKYIGISTRLLPCPRSARSTFEVDIAAGHRVATAGHVVARLSTARGVLEPRRPAPAIRRDGARGPAGGRRAQHGRLLTGQLFDWFVPAVGVRAHRATAHHVTGNTSNPGSPARVGLDKAYTQIVKNIPVTPGQAHHVAISFTRNASRSSVAYVLDGKVVAKVTNVGMPLDRQGVR